MIALAPKRVARGLRAACLTELRVAKPGNVSMASPGHGMSARDFVASARVAAPALAAAAGGVGERVLRAVEATRAVAGCNTNLGIVLLCAPLAHAALVPAAERALRPRLEAVLAALDRRDAELAYRAIRLAAPGGLGTAPAHDVRAAPAVTLLEAMRTAAAWDRIAFQYAYGYADIFAFALPCLERTLARFGPRRESLLGLYLELLARFPDSHVARRHGIRAAEELSARAARLAARLAARGATARFRAEAQAFDRELKRRGVNPGTTADLTVATLFARCLARELAAAAPAAMPWTTRVRARRCR
ncbi:MAG TPA: triphosphoribosyl-dephospho-CoA synthase [Burkholderiales bacterium]